MRRLLACSLLWATVAPWAATQTTIDYAPAAADVANPERGFYRYSDTYAGRYTPLSEDQLLAWRAGSPSGSGNYSVKATLVFRYFFLEDFRFADVSAEYLAAMQADFDVARAAGVKLIPRFAYTAQTRGDGCDGDICPPYGDAPKRWVLRHVEQVAPVLRANADVIATLQMGFIGIWGENYYTDYFGDPSQGPAFKLTDENWADRTEVLTELLRALPPSRTVQVRYPQAKQRALAGARAPTSTPVMGLAEAYTNADVARIGFHNDCLLAGPNDLGTYSDYGNDVSPSRSDTAALKPYAAAEGRFLPVGGETCSDDYSPTNDCVGTAPEARGEAELRRMRHSYLNADFNNDVNDDWAAGGCMEAIKRELGYRLELVSGTFSDAVAPGEALDLRLDLRNAGYAAPFNPRDLDLILRSRSTGEVFTAELPDDPRYWFGGNDTYAITQSACVPPSVPAGDYELLLHLPDPEPRLRERPAYAIRLASLLPGGVDGWEAATGYNALGHTVSVGAGGNATCSAEIAFAPTSGSLPVDLLAFSAEATATSDIELRWETASERDNEGFGIERSTDGQAFVELAFAEAGGDDGARYTYVDSSASLGTRYYYRLAQRDLDGTVAYSATVSAVAAASGTADVPGGGLDAFPNPVTDHLTLRWRGGSRVGPGTLRLTDALGRLVLEQRTSGEASESVDLSSVPVGVYTLRVRVGGGDVVVRVAKGSGG